MRILYSFVLILFISLSTHAQFIYRFNGTKVFKADTLGNVYWVKNFAGKINPLVADSNVIQGVFKNTNRLFVAITQSPLNGSVYFTSYPAIVTLDTSGNIINNIYWPEFSCGTSAYYFYPMRSDGGWLFYQRRDTFYNMNRIYSYMLKVDSTGNFSPGSISPMINHSVYSVLNVCQPLYDSSLLVVSTSQDGLMNNYFIYTKVDDSGHVLWQNLFPLNQWDQAYHAAIVSDSLGNIYSTGIIYFFEANIDRCKFGVICDSLGQVTNSKYWPAIEGYPANEKLSISNNHLIDSSFYSYGNVFKITFDMNFNSSCVTDTALSLYTLSMPIDSLSVPVVLHSSFVPFNDTTSFTYNPFNVATPLDYCIFLSDQDKLVTEKFNCYYDNAGRIIINDAFLQEFKIYTCIGKLVFHLVSNFAFNSVDVKNWTNGIYIVKAISGGNELTKKLLILN
jgi:hypothetical protein